MSIQVKQMLCPSSKKSIKFPYAMTPTRIVVHNTANDASAQNEIKYMCNNNNEVSFHFALPSRFLLGRASNLRVHQATS